MCVTTEDSYTKVIANIPIIVLTNNPTCSPHLELFSFQLQFCQLWLVLEIFQVLSHAFSQYYSLVLALVSQARLHFSSLIWHVHDQEMESCLIYIILCSSISEYGKQYYCICNFMLYFNCSQVGWLPSGGLALITLMIDCNYDNYWLYGNCNSQEGHACSNMCILGTLHKHTYCTVHLCGDTKAHAFAMRVLFNF